MFYGVLRLKLLFFSRYFETINVRGSEADNIHHRLTYTHRLKSGVAHSDDYGIVLAELSGLPKSVTEKARKYASEQVVFIYCLLIRNIIVIIVLLLRG